MKISFTNFVLGLIIFILVVISSSVYRGQKDLKDEIVRLENELKEAHEINEIYENTRTFLKLSSEGKHGEFLTGKAKEEYEKALEQEGFGVWEGNHTQESDVKNVEILHISAEKVSDSEAKSNVVYRVFQSNNPYVDNITTQRILTLVLIADWVETKDGYKVYNYKINLLEDSLDEYLRDLQKGDKHDEKSTEKSTEKNS